MKSGITDLVGTVLAGSLPTLEHSSPMKPRVGQVIRVADIKAE
jgi:hypothetical protein